MDAPFTLNSFVKGAVGRSPPNCRSSDVMSIDRLLDESLTSSTETARRSPLNCLKSRDWIMSENVLSWHQASLELRVRRIRKVSAFLRSYRSASRIRSIRKNSPTSYQTSVTLAESWFPCAEGINHASAWRSLPNAKSSLIDPLATSARPRLAASISYSARLRSVRPQNRRGYRDLTRLLHDR
jgi:hypothetical protein